MVSAANQKAMRTPTSRSIIGARIPTEPYVAAAWRKQHPGRTSGRATCSPSRGRPARATTVGTTRSTTSTRRTGAAGTLKGIDEQVAKAERAVAGKTG